MAKDKYAALTRVLKNSTSLEKHLYNSKTHYVLEIKPEMGVNIRYIPIPELTDDTHWTYRWVETDGRHDRGKLIAIPRHRRTKTVLRNLIYNRLKYEGFSEFDADLLSRIINHKPFDVLKLATLKELIVNLDNLKKIIEMYHIKDIPNETKYELFDKLEITRPSDYNTYGKMVGELERYLSCKEKSNVR